VLDAAADGIVVLDESARILVFNKACERLFGYAGEEMLGRDIKTIVALEDAVVPHGFISDYLFTEGVGGSHSVTGRHRDGNEFPVTLFLAESMTPEGRQFICFLRDLRTRDPAEQSRHRRQADLLDMARVSAMDEMSAALAHEINQPLTALMLYIQAVERVALQAPGTSVPESALLILQKAMREAERAGHIIQRMRRFASGREPVRRAVDLNALVDDALELILLGSSREAKIERMFAPQLPVIIVDPVQIQQVVIDLVRNALAVARTPSTAQDRAKDAPQETPDVRIATRQSGGAVMVDVEDNGPGISSAVISGLFTAFSSTECAGQSQNLAMSKSIAQNHGGELLVDPGGQGRGARFTLQLPLALRRAIPDS